MSGRPTYFPRALSRIEGVGEKAILVFFNEVPSELLKIVTGILPPVAGFRPGTNGAVQKQLQSLSRKLATHRTPTSFSHSSEEKVLYQLWRAWSQSHLPERAVTQELFDGLDEDEDEESTSPNRSERMATALKALVAGGTCARETLERFVTFSPFENVGDFFVLVAGARTSAEIKRDSTLLDLPDRLQKHEDRLHLLETTLEASESNAPSIRLELKEISSAVSDLQTKAVEDRASVSELRQTIVAATESQKALQEAVARLNHATDRLAGRVAVSEKQMESIAQTKVSIQGDVATIAKNLQHLSEQVLTFDRRLDQIPADVRAGAAALKTQSERVAEVVVRINELESILLELATRKPAIKEGAELNRQEEIIGRTFLESAEPVFRVEQLRLESGLSAKRLHSIAEVLSSLDGALVDAGLKKSTASTFAEEILAAVASEQIVFFRGGIAVDVARKCALSFCGTSVFRVAIPSGMTDPSLLRQRLDNRPNPASGNVSAIIVEGVNNSPLDVLRDILLDQVTYRVGSLGRQAPSVMFASMADGAGAFPLEPSFLELGPMFDLEQMDWRRLRREKLPVLGFVEHDDWQSIAATWDGKPIDFEEALQGAKQFSRKRNTRFEANVVRAFSALKIIRREKGPTALQSVTFGWLAPFWQSLNAKTDDIDAQIDGGKCDGTIVDERLKSFLTEWRGQDAGGRE